MDPLAEKYQGWNPYNYVLDNPLKFNDSDGRGPAIAIGGAVLTAGEATVLVCAGVAATASAIGLDNTAKIARGAGSWVDNNVNKPIIEGIQAGLGWLGEQLGITTVPPDAGTQQIKTLETDGTTAENQTDAKENTNPYKGPIDQSVTIVDGQGNAIPVAKGQQVAGSADGAWVQVKDGNGKPTGVRKDGPHSPKTHKDPRAQKPHGHRPDAANPDGTPWLPIEE